ncbi:MAG: DNA polymerase III subunit gamma/tau, partial [Alistipes sp.]|nr:DNA polymerase III subunit gamma/tau [Alistipes sp.]
ISHERPRFVPSFEQMTISNFTIGISVPTQELHDEIVRNQTALLTAIAREAGVEGKIDLEVTVNEQIRAARPFRLEDRVRYMTEKNPLLVELKEALGLEFE